MQYDPKRLERFKKQWEDLHAYPKDPTVSANYIYGSEYRDEYLLKNPESLPRYGHLARKAFMHYAKDRYNPHDICYFQEVYVRDMIRSVIRYKVLYRTGGYDREWIDHWMRHIMNCFFDLDLPCDMYLLERGTNYKMHHELNSLERPV